MHPFFCAPMFEQGVFSVDFVSLSAILSAFDGK